MMRDGSLRHGVFTYYAIYSDPVKQIQGACCLFLELDGSTVAQGKSGSYFNALLQLRKRLEERDAIVLCWGARQRVWPTGIQNDMGAGLAASIRNEDGTAAGEKKWIFEPIEPEVASSVNDQIEFAKRIYRLIN